jgi:hypothetical protein
MAVQLGIATAFGDCIGDRIVQTLKRERDGHGTKLFPNEENGLTPSSEL